MSSKPQFQLAASPKRRSGYFTVCQSLYHRAASALSARCSNEGWPLSVPLGPLNAKSVDYSAGVPVYCVLPDFVTAALEASPHSSERFYFWTGAAALHGAIGKWQQRLQRLFALAKVPKGHAHRFRDTFAVELLLAGVPLERVSVLLGHQSIRVTERHYAPWTRSRQEQIEADLQKAWSEDPVALLQAQRVRSRYTGKRSVPIDSSSTG
jgi:hypothetical protein